MRLLLCIILAVALLCGQAGCTQVAGVMLVMVGMLLDDDDCDGPRIQPNEREIQSDLARHARGEPLRYHQDERELRRHQADVRAMKQTRTRGQ